MFMIVDWNAPGIKSGTKVLSSLKCTLQFLSTKRTDMCAFDVCVGVQGLGTSSNKSTIVDVTQILGPLHTQAKSLDHEIVRAPQKVSKGHLKTLSQSRSVVSGPQV
jgi:hypothetical protein